MTKFGKNLTIAIAALLASAMPANAQTQPQSPQAAAKIAMPAPEALIVMIRSSVVALAHANTTNNYTVLNQMGSENFRQSNSARRLSRLFTPFRSNNIDLAPVVFLTPQLTQAPRIENGRLQMVGFFPSQPMQVNFDLMFEPSEGVWKLYGLSVNLTKAAARVTEAPQKFAPEKGQTPAGR